jgi:hypothetical protein
VRLAREAPADNIRQSTASLKDRIACNILDASKADRIGKVAVIHGAGEGLDLGVGETDKAISISLRYWPLTCPWLASLLGTLIGVGHSFGQCLIAFSSPTCRLPFAVLPSAIASS